MWVFFLLSFFCYSSIASYCLINLVIFHYILDGIFCKLFGENLEAWCGEVFLQRRYSFASANNSRCYYSRNILTYYKSLSLLDHYVMQSWLQIHERAGLLRVSLHMEGLVLQIFNSKEAWCIKSLFLAGFSPQPLCVYPWDHHQKGGPALQLLPQTWQKPLGKKHF